MGCPKFERVHNKAYTSHIKKSIILLIEVTNVMITGIEAWPIQQASGDKTAIGLFILFRREICIQIWRQHN